MADLTRSEIIEDYRIGSRLSNFRDTFRLSCDQSGIPVAPDALSQLDREGSCPVCSCACMSDHGTVI